MRPHVSSKNSWPPAGSSVESDATREMNIASKLSVTISVHWTFSNLVPLPAFMTYSLSNRDKWLHSHPGLNLPRENWSLTSELPTGIVTQSQLPRASSSCRGTFKLKNRFWNSEECQLLTILTTINSMKRRRRKGTHTRPHTLTI